MDSLLLIALLLILSAFISIRIFNTDRNRRSSGKATLPPGPRRLPIIGNILEMSDKPHRSLAKLTQTYGPIISLKLGSVMTIVISSAEAAREALQTHDQALSSRTISDSMRACGHHEVSMVWLPASTRWRYLRRISATQLFMPQKLDSTRTLRASKVKELLNFVHESCDAGKAVDIGRAAFVTLLNMISNTFVSLNFGHYHSDVSQKYYEVVVGTVNTIGTPNIADYFPILGFFDPQGTRKQMAMYQDKLIQMFRGIIEERTKKRISSAESKNSASNDLLDSLLDIAEDKDAEFSVTDAEHLLADLFVAGIDTSSSTVEWAMTELLCDPKALAKAQAEIRQVVGQNGVVQESDISQLPYLQAVVKETFRLHPPIPLLIPHRAESQVEILGYLVPKNAQVLVNVWAIGRDPSVWVNPSSFEPERFLGRETDVKGKDFELIPFGAGRRICPGLPLAQRIVHLVLASFIYAFDWKLEDGVTVDNLHTGEVFGLTLHKAQPLRAVPIKT